MSQGVIKLSFHTPPINKGERLMTKINVAAIEALCNRAPVDDLSDLETRIGLPADLAKQLAELQAKEQEEISRAAAAEIYKLLKHSQSMINAHVENIREARKAEAKSKAQIRSIEQARLYGNETSDYMPLLCVMGYASGHSVPADWQPAGTEATKKTTQAAKASKK